jgi:hypothetical protein
MKVLWQSSSKFVHGDVVGMCILYYGGEIEIWLNSAHPCINVSVTLFHELIHGIIMRIFNKINKLFEWKLHLFWDCLSSDIMNRFSTRFTVEHLKEIFLP